MIMQHEDWRELALMQRKGLLIASSSLAIFAMQGYLLGDWPTAVWQLGTTGVLLTAAYKLGVEQGWRAVVKQAALRDDRSEAATVRGQPGTDAGKQPDTEQARDEHEKLSMAGMLAAGIAHEIRNPLTSLRGFLQLSTAKMKPEYLEIMLSEVDRINEIVSELLELAKPKEMTHEERDLRVLLEQTVMLLEAQANLHNVTIALTETVLPITISCEENKLKQVFINLMKNAIEAAAGGGAIAVSVRIEGGDAAVEIRDTGQGIEADKLEQLGQPFYTTKEQGSGLGLMVCRRIVQDHGGTMAFDSTWGEGTIVTVRLPCIPS